MKISYFLKLILFVVVFNSCKSLEKEHFTFHLTENSPTIDTTIQIKDGTAKYSSMHIYRKGTWNDTIIYQGQKLPKGSINEDFVRDGFINSCRLIFDKYKATEVDIVHTEEFY